MPDDQTRTELAQLRARLAAQEADFAAFRARLERPHRRLSRRP